MCGINGIFAYRASAPPVEEGELLRVRDAMAKRGPDGAGLWISPDRRVGLAHRRLTIIDLSDASAQPMATADGRLHITFNGEIYNYKALRKELEQKGFVFRSQSDTEVLLHLYADRGADMVHALRGMYAFGIWDERDKTLFLARDPFGIKPLYFADDGATVRFASQVKALALAPSVDLSEDPAGYVSFCLWGSVSEPFTLHKGIRSVGSGESILIGRDGKREVRRHFSLLDEVLKAEEASAAPVSLKESLVDSVSHHLVADVPVAVFQSAGLDSSTITGMASSLLARKLTTVTLGFEEYRNTEGDEVPLAQEVARVYGTDHHVARVSREDFEAELDALLKAMDQPSIDGANTYFVAKAAAQHGVKVALSGLGGDELFAGYPSFRELPILARWLRPASVLPAFGRAFRAVLAPLLGRLTSPKYAGVFEYGGTPGGAYLLRRGLYMPWELERFFSPAFVHDGLEALDPIASSDELVREVQSDRLRVMLLETSRYLRNQLLRDADWAGMAHSLEIRVPFVDGELYRRLLPALAQADPPGKAEMAKTLDVPLPQSLLQRPKTGFSVPVRDWMQAKAPADQLERGLRGWAKVVCPGVRDRFRILAFVTDAFGGHGGIAKFNRDFLTSLGSAPFIKEVVALPRVALFDEGRVPPGVTWVKSALGGTLNFLSAAVRFGLFGSRSHLIVCGHINLIPIAWLAALFHRAPLVLIVHGIDAWRPTGCWLVNALVSRIDAYIAVSNLTRDRLRSWASVDHARSFLLPNCVDLERFRPAPPRADLIARYGLAGAKTLLTLGRLDSAERYKGFDEALDAIPRLLGDIPKLRYMIAGDGSDLDRLRAKAKALGLEENVVFAGFVPEDEKPDLYNLADTFVMPSRGEGFGIVFLEAMACGVPVIGSITDGGKEALLDGVLGQLVDPDSPGQLIDAIRKALRTNKGVPRGLDRFEVSRFSQSARALVHELLAGRP